MTEQNSIYQLRAGALQSHVRMQLKHIFAEIITSWLGSKETKRESLLSAFRWPLRDGKCEHVGLPSLVRLSAWQIAQGVIVTLMGNAHRQRGTLNVSWLPDITHADPKHRADG